jgi:hypothetical protein
LTANLDRPEENDDLYLARGPDVSPHRPVLPGDVFSDVEIGGLGLQDLIIVMSHPCTMRAGARLKPRLQAAQIRRDQQAVALDEWAEGHFRIMPLPGLESDANHYSAVLSEIGLIQSPDLYLERRKACLSDLGIYLLQQRQIFCQTRAKVGLDTLADASQHVLEEADLLEEWSEALASGESEDALIAVAEEFDLFLKEPTAASLRSKLELPRERPGVRRTVRAEIAARRGSGP